MYYLYTGLYRYRAIDNVYVFIVSLFSHYLLASWLFVCSGAVVVVDAAAAAATFCFVIIIINIYIFLFWGQYDAI